MSDIPAKFAAKFNGPEVAWRLTNSAPIVIGPEPKLVLSLRALRDVEIHLWKVDFPEYEQKLSHDMIGAEAESIVVQVPHVTGKRTLRPEGESWVNGLEDVDAGPMLGDVKIAPQLRWDGALGLALEHNICRYPAIYWAWRGKMIVPAGGSVGVIVRANRPTTCKVKMAGT